MHVHNNLYCFTTIGDFLNYFKLFGFVFSCLAWHDCCRRNVALMLPGPNVDAVTVWPGPTRNPFMRHMFAAMGPATIPMEIKPTPGEIATGP